MRPYTGERFCDERFPTNTRQRGMRDDSMCGLSIAGATESTHRGGDGKKPTLAVPFPGRRSEEATLYHCAALGEFPTSGPSIDFYPLPTAHSNVCQLYGLQRLPRRGTQGPSTHPAQLWSQACEGAGITYDSPFSQRSPQKSLSLLYILLSCTTPSGSQTTVSTSSTVSQRMAQALY